MKTLTKVRKRNLYACFIISLMYGFGESGFFVILQPLLLEITGILFSVGVIMTIVSLVQVILMPLIGKLMDRFGRKKLWLIASPIIIFGCILLIVAMNIILAGVAVILIYMGGVIHTMSSLMIISENSEDSKKGSNFSFRFFAGSSASIIGFMLVLFNIGPGYHFYIWLFIVMNVFLWLVAFFALSPTKTDFIKERNSMNTIKKNKMVELFQNPKIRKIVIFFTLNWFFYGVTVTIWNAWFVDTYGVTEQALALFFLVFNIFRMIIQISAGSIIDKIGKKKALIISLICCIISSFISIFVFFTWSIGFKFILIPGYIMANIFFAIYLTLIIPIESIYLTNLNESRKAESFGTVKLIIDGALIPTGVIGGSLADFIHPLAPEIVHLGGFIFLLGTSGRYFDIRKQEKAHENTID